MPSALEVPWSPEKQHRFNLRRWMEVVHDPSLERWPGRIETTRHGEIIMVPPPAPYHGRFEYVIARLLEIHLPHGVALTECAISTPEGVRAADAAWMPRKLLNASRKSHCLPSAPPICVEVVSPRNTKRELAEKIRLYFSAGATEVWLCDRLGKISFYLSPDERVDASRLCPDFPKMVSL